MPTQMNTASILDRARATRNAQDSLKTAWMWDEQTLAQWDTDIAAIHSNQTALDAALADERAKRGTLDHRIRTLTLQTKKGIALAKGRYRNDPSKMAVVRRMTIRKLGRTDLMATAAAWAAAWNELDPTWSPLPNVTLATFNALRTSAETAQTEYERAHTEQRTIAEALNQDAQALDSLNKAWYAAATRVFPADTAEGAMIRGTVPTTYSRAAVLRSQKNAQTASTPDSPPPAAPTL